MKRNFDPTRDPQTFINNNVDRLMQEYIESHDIPEHRMDSCGESDEYISRESQYAIDKMIDLYTENLNY